MSAAPETMPPPAAPPPVRSPRPAPISPLPTTCPLPARHIVHWFRKGLRLHDNPSLRAAIAGAKTYRCIFIIDPWFACSSNVGINKWRFLLQCLHDLDVSLRKLNSRLFVVRGQPADALPKLFREWETTHFSFEEDPEPYGRVRDHNISTKCREVGIVVISRTSHTLYKLDKIIERNGGKAPLTYHQFQALIAAMPPPAVADPAITLNDINGAVTPIKSNHDDKFGVPTLDELGFDTDNLKAPVWVGGESEGLARLERHLERKAWVASFGRPKMTPQSLLASPTGLSPYLRFGCVSTRLFYYQLTELYMRINHVRPPLSLHGQILWREFFYCASTRNPNFDKMKGNPICVQIPWDKNPKALAKWGNGQTGYPWIDAVMVQLREEGWVHHLARHAVACFLTRGDLWISWEEGMKVFDELLLDVDWSLNAGMWMWLSCSSFFQQFHHCYCPVRFGRKVDSNGDYIRRYIPALKDMPTQYIHEPWMAPKEIQEAARCVVGRDYPVPMIDHDKASYINNARIKNVYSRLSNYKPEMPTSYPGSLNPNVVQRPNETQSSPSPTSIIRSINQSQYLCSQPVDRQFTTNPDNLLFQRPGTNNKPRDYTNHPLFKQVLLVYKSTFGNKSRFPNPIYTYRTANQTISVNQDKYNFQNLAIGGSCPERYPAPQLVYTKQRDGTHVIPASKAKICEDDKCALVAPDCKSDDDVVHETKETANDKEASSKEDDVADSLSIKSMSVKSPVHSVYEI